MSDHGVPLARIRAARERLAGRIHHTPMLSSATAARVVRAVGGVDVADGRVYLKAEHLQKTGSFKPRAALTRIASLDASERSAGAITLSAGNAGQAYAWAGREAGVPVTVVMPAGAVASKVAACRGYGATVVLHGEHVGEALAYLQVLREERGLTFVHPYDDLEVLIGNGSLGLEILDDLPDVDVVVVGIGGGGLIGGVAAAISQVRPEVRIFGVEPRTSDAMAVALEHGAPVRITPVSVADGLGAPAAGGYALRVVRETVADVVRVDDAAILAGLRFAMERTRQVLEPAGSAALGALLTGAVPVRSGDRVCVILSGGNVAIERLGELLAGAAPLEIPA